MLSVYHDVSNKSSRYLKRIATTYSNLSTALCPRFFWFLAFLVPCINFVVYPAIQVARGGLPVPWVISTQIHADLSLT